MAKVQRGIEAGTLGSWIVTHGQGRAVQSQMRELQYQHPEIVRWELRPAGGRNRVLWYLRRVLPLAWRRRLPDYDRRGLWTWTPLDAQGRGVKL